ncbi:hypothetical protein DYBT9275_01333 [Dyadobacter sp. CECT 9275]|uniref:SdiA-regulated family protein n=1 Tax=Dyadobacter helix TaxID=2822344 RepID=A0A916NKD3_9BACT|nr:SdiA-regulated domain-containing protein [Dyadobacter sp. CECT 9275]CAG4994163.1 hypothetical protein DYBT9275_01333 [Dyadobacter sp. CECT 9275]
MKNSVIRLIALSLITIGLAACNATTKEKEEVFEEYDLHSPDEFNMPESLFEISGITFYKGNSDTVYAIQDEEGKLFRLGWDVKVQRHTKFGKKGDYEDVAILNDQVVILKSNGHLFTFPFSEAVYEEPAGVKELDQVLPKGEYEGMYGDEKTGKLYVICKNCPQDNSKKRVSGYILKLGDQAKTAGNFSINVDEIKAISGKVERGFRPSAMAQNPVTSEWYIISAVNKLLVITDTHWKVKHAFGLNGNTFNQPEGIAFDKTGNMYISDEGDDLSDGNILKFVRKK